MTSADHRVRDLLDQLYGQKDSETVLNKLKEKLDHFNKNNPVLTNHFQTKSLTQENFLLITYADQVREPGQRPLQTLSEFINSHFGKIVPDIHLLPFYPYSSDDGFSVIDFYQVDPSVGTWEDILELGEQYRLMFDAVINHVSRKSAWFNNFLENRPGFTEDFIDVSPDTDLSEVFRPRALPLLTPIETPQGVRHIWSTFSDDQMDLNYANPDVLLKVIDILLFYVAHKARYLRLDAIAFLWKTIGTRCLNLPQTHMIIKLLRAVLDLVAPEVLLITETNIPHHENISYFGNGQDEAQLVYNFALPPLTLQAFHTGNASKLSAWASGLELPSSKVTFFNFLASHDGIGITPARGILDPAEIEAVIERVNANGGMISYRNLPNGEQMPYEFNINYFDALSAPDSGEPLDVQIDRFITAHAVMLSLVGVPGIYFHSLFGSRGWREGFATTGIKRSINRQKYPRAVLEAEMTDAALPRGAVFRRLKQLLKARSERQAFDPFGPQQVIDVNPAVYALIRGEQDKGQVLCLHNVSATGQMIGLDLDAMGIRRLEDIFKQVASPSGTFTLELKPYQTLWLDIIR